MRQQDFPVKLSDSEGNELEQIAPTGQHNAGGGRKSCHGVMRARATWTSPTCRTAQL